MNSKSLRIRIYESFRGGQGTTGAGGPVTRRLRAALLIVAAAFAMVLASNLPLYNATRLSITPSSART